MYLYISILNSSYHFIYVPMVFLCGGVSCCSIFSFLCSVLYIIVSHVGLFIFAIALPGLLRFTAFDYPPLVSSNFSFYLCIIPWVFHLWLLSFPAAYSGDIALTDEDIQVANQRYIEQEDDDIHELQIEDQRLEPSQSNNQINKLENINEQKSTLRHRKISKRRNKNIRRLRKRRRRQKCLRWVWDMT